MAIDLKSFGKEVLGGSFLGKVLYGGGGSVDWEKAGYASGGGGQPPLLDNPAPQVEQKGGFLGGVKDFIDSLLDRPSANVGREAGAAFGEKIKPWLIGGAVVGGALLLMKMRKR